MLRSEGDGWSLREFEGTGAFYGICYCCVHTFLILVGDWSEDVVGSEGWIGSDGYR